MIRIASFVIALVAPYFATRFTVINSKTLLPQYICIADSLHETMEYSTDNDRPCKFTRLIKLPPISGSHLTSITHAKPHNGFRVLTGVQCSVQDSSLKLPPAMYIIHLMTNANRFDVASGHFL